MMIVVKILICSIIVGFSNGIYLNPYSYGSYDPAAEYPHYYNYYARYYNPNPHNPYAPYPTYMKPGVFRLPRMYQIDPAWAPYYPPNRYETLPVATYPQQPGNVQSYYRPQSARSRDESIAVFPEGCGDTEIASKPTVSYQSYHRSPQDTVPLLRPFRARSTIKEPKTEAERLLEDLDKGGSGGFITVDKKGDSQRPQWSATQPTDEQLRGFARPATLVRPRINHWPIIGIPAGPREGQTSLSSRSSPPFDGNIRDNSDVASDFERLPLDRINSSPDSDSNGFPTLTSSSSGSNFYRQKRRYNLQ